MTFVSQINKSETSYYTTEERTTSNNHRQQEARTTPLLTNPVSKPNRRPKLQGTNIADALLTHPEQLRTTE